MNAFKRLTIDTHFSVLTEQRVCVTWAMNEAFTEPGPWEFVLQRGWSPTDDNWTDISSTSDQPWLYDNYPVHTQYSVPVFYRIRLTDGNGIVYYSQAQSSTNHWERYDWTLAKEIVRKENMLLRKRTGTKGWLLKRRYFGDPCPVCRDPVTGELNQSECTTCYNTGITGGYYPAIEYWVAQEATRRMRKLDSNQGIISDTSENVRGLAYPAVEGNDVWVNAHTNNRYFIGGDVQVVARHRGVDLVLNLTLQDVPNLSPIYMISVPP
jgi:hypothetical protein